MRIVDRPGRPLSKADHKALVNAAKKRLTEYIVRLRGAEKGSRKAEMSRARFASECDVNINSVQSYEKGEVDPYCINVFTIRRLAHLGGLDEYTFRRYLYEGMSLTAAAPKFSDDEWLFYCQVVPLDVAIRGKRTLDERLETQAMNPKGKHNGPLLEAITKWKEEYSCSDKLIEAHLTFPLSLLKKGVYITNDQLFELSAFTKIPLEELITLRDSHEDAPPAHLPEPWSEGKRPLTISLLAS